MYHQLLQGFQGTVQACSLLPAGAQSSCAADPVSWSSSLLHVARILHPLHREGRRDAAYAHQLHSLHTRVRALVAQVEQQHVALQRHPAAGTDTRWEEDVVRMRDAARHQICEVLPEVIRDLEEMQRLHLKVFKHLKTEFSREGWEQFSQNLAEDISVLQEMTGLPSSDDWALQARDALRLLDPAPTPSVSISEEDLLRKLGSWGQKEDLDLSSGSVIFPITNALLCDLQEKLSAPCGPLSEEMQALLQQLGPLQEASAVTAERISEVSRMVSDLVNFWEQHKVDIVHSMEEIGAAMLHLFHPSHRIRTLVRYRLETTRQLLEDYRNLYRTMSALSAASRRKDSTLEKLLDFGSRLQGCLEECSSKSGNDVLASEALQAFHVEWESSLKLLCDEEFLSSCPEVLPMIEEHCAVNFPLTRLADLVKGYPFSLVLVQAPVLGLKSDAVNESGLRDLSIPPEVAELSSFLGGGAFQPFSLEWHDRLSPGSPLRFVRKPSLGTTHVAQIFSLLDSHDRDILQSLSSFFNLRQRDNTLACISSLLLPLEILFVEGSNVIAVSSPVGRDVEVLPKFLLQQREGSNLCQKSLLRKLLQLFAFVEDAGFLLRLLSFDSIVVQDSGQRLLLADYRSLVNVVALGQQQKASPGSVLSFLASIHPFQLPADVFSHDDLAVISPSCLGSFLAGKALESVRALCGFPVEDGFHTLIASLCHPAREKRCSVNQALLHPLFWEASVENGSGNLVASPRGEEADIVEYDEAVDEDAPVSLQFQEGDDILDYFYTMLDPKVEVLSEEEVARRSESHQSSLAQAMEYLSQCSSLHDAAVTHVLQVDPSSGDFLQEVLEQLLAVKDWHCVFEVACRGNVVLDHKTFLWKFFHDLLLSDDAISTLFVRGSRGKNGRGCLLPMTGPVSVAQGRQLEVVGKLLSLALLHGVPIPGHLFAPSLFPVLVEAGHSDICLSAGVLSPSSSCASSHPFSTSQVMGQSRGSFALVVALNLFDPAFGRQKRVEALTGQDGSDVSPSDEEPSSLQVSAYERLVRSRMFALSAMADGFWSVVAEHKEEFVGSLPPSQLQALLCTPRFVSAETVFASIFFVAGVPRIFQDALQEQLQLWESQPDGLIWLSGFLRLCTGFSCLPLDSKRIRVMMETPPPNGSMLSAHVHPPVLKISKACPSGLQFCKSLSHAISSLDL